MTTVLFPDQHWCRQYGTPCTNANIWNECRLTACNRIRTYPPAPVVEIKREESNMTNREWLENLSDERIARLLGIEPCDNYCTCANGCNDECVEGIIEWLQSEHEEPKKELTQAQLYQAFKDKFNNRRAISINEAEKIIEGVFKE